MNILEAMTDQELFGKTFKRGLLRGDSWRAWRAFLIALFGLPFDDEAREIFQKHTARSDDPSEQFREAYLVVGRRSGKSRVAALIATFIACFRDYTEVLAPGEIGVLPIIAPDRKQCQIILGYIAGYFEASPTLREHGQDAAKGKHRADKPSQNRSSHGQLSKRKRLYGDWLCVGRSGFSPLGR